MSFYDSKGVLDQWFYEWRASIFRDNQLVLPLEQCIRRLKYAQLNEWRDRLDGYDCMVFPSGEAQIKSGENAAIRTTFVEFQIVKMIPLQRS